MVIDTIIYTFCAGFFLHTKKIYTLYLKCYASFSFFSHQDSLREKIYIQCYQCCTHFPCGILNQPVLLLWQGVRDKVKVNEWLVNKRRCELRRWSFQTKRSIPFFIKWLLTWNDGCIQKKSWTSASAMSPDSNQKYIMRERHAYHRRHFLDMVHWERYYFQVCHALPLWPSGISILDCA